MIAKERAGRQLRGFCATGAGNGIDNSCGSQEKMAPDGMIAAGGSNYRPKTLEQERLEAAGTWGQEKWDSYVESPYDGGDHDGYVPDLNISVAIPGLPNQTTTINIDDPEQVAQYITLSAKSKKMTPEEFMKSQRFGGSLKATTPSDKAKLFGGSQKKYEVKVHRSGGWGNKENDAAAKKIGSILRAAGIRGDHLSDAVREHAKKNGTDPKDDMYSGLKTFKRDPYEFIDWVRDRMDGFDPKKSKKSKRSYEQLVAFLEERDRQLRLPFPEDGGGSDCTRQSGGRFGAGNDCASDGSGSSSSWEGGIDDPSPPQPSNSGSGSSAIESIQNGTYTGSIKGAEKIKSLTVDSASEVKALLKETSIDDLSTLLEIGVGNSDNSKTTISHLTSATWASGDRVPFSQVRVGSSVPIDPSNASAGNADVTVMIEKQGDNPPFVHYGFLQRDGEAQRTIKKEKEANPDTGYSKTEAGLGAAIFDRMLSSLDAARKAGMAKAVTEAAGYPGSDTFQGYRLWGRFGFDAPLVKAHVDQILSESLMGRPVVSEEIATKAGRTKEIYLQDLLSTKQGEAWWKKNGSAINMTLDFSDKDSAGMKRLEKMLSMRERSKSRGSRSYLEFTRFASRADVSFDLAEWRGFRESDLEERLQAVFEFASQRNCGNGAGGFVKGNTCASGVAADVAKGAAKGAVTGVAAAVGKTAGFPPAVAAGATVGATVGAVKGLYDSQMRPTRAGKAIAKVGTTDEKIASLVKSLGGSNKSIAEADGKDALSLDVKDDKGKRLFDVQLTKDGVTIKPSPGRDSLTPSQIESIKDIAKEHHGVKVVVQGMPATAISRMAKAGFSLAYDAAVGLVAGFTAPMLPGLVGTVIESTTGFDIEASGVVQPIYNVLDKVADKVIH